MNKTIHSIFPLLVSSLLFNTTNVLADPPIVGILYSTLHCPSATNSNPKSTVTPFDISQILRSTPLTRKWNKIPNGVHWWGQPDYGYYCLSDPAPHTYNNTETTIGKAILTEHAKLLSEAGIDFILVDMTNHYTSGDASVRFKEMIEKPFKELVKVWSDIDTAPKIIPWVKVHENLTEKNLIEGHKHTIQLLYELYKDSNSKFRELTYHVESPSGLFSKPVLFVSPETLPVGGSDSVYANDRIDSYRHLFLIQKMWTGTHTSNVAQDWNYLAPCQNGFKAQEGNQACGQQATQLSDGSPKHISVSAAYQKNYMSNNWTAVPKFHGKTLIQQFITAAGSGANIVTINDWNSWVVSRQKVSKDPDVYQFTDSYDKEYNRDLERGGGMGDYYYQLLKEAVPLLKNSDKVGLRDILNGINNSAPVDYSFISPN